MKFAEVELRQITEETWKIILAEGLELSSQPGTPGKFEDSIAACAQITGDWRLAVVLNCPSAAARQAATAMFATAQADEKAEDVQDAMCELVNIIAGNVKGLLSGNNCLSLPSLVKGSDFRFDFPRHILLAEAWFEFNSQPVLVRLLGEDRLAVSDTKADAMETNSR